jgi:hypothetical protein
MRQSMSTPLPIPAAVSRPIESPRSPDEKKLRILRMFKKHMNSPQTARQLMLYP